MSKKDSFIRNILSDCMVKVPYFSPFYESQSKADVHQFLFICNSMSTITECLSTAKHVKNMSVLQNCFQLKQARQHSMKHKIKEDSYYLFLKMYTLCRTKVDNILYQKQNLNSFHFVKSNQIPLKSKYSK